MKKVLSILLVLCIAATLFAATGLTVKAGGAFGFASYKAPDTFKTKDGQEYKWNDFTEIELADKTLVLKTNGFGFDVGVQYDISEKLMVYTDFNMLFPKDSKTNFPDVMLFHYIDEELMDKYIEDGKLKIYSINGIIADLEKSDEIEFDFSLKNSFFSVSAGVAYKFDFNAVKLNVGGGVMLNKATAKYKAIYEAYDEEHKYEGTISFTSFGVSALVEAKYMVAENIGIGLTLMPQLGLYNKAVVSLSNDDEYNNTFTSKGIKLSFAMPIALGVSYSF